jgi:TPR repeat protein
MPFKFENKLGQRNTKTEQSNKKVERHFSILSVINPSNLSDHDVKEAIGHYEKNELEKGTSILKSAAENKSPVGLLLYGIALRHGWGVKEDQNSAFYYLQKAAELAVIDINSEQKELSYKEALKPELAVTLFELGNCFRHGWGVVKNKQTAAYYFEYAAKLGDPDAQLELALCYKIGDGVKKNKKEAAKYYRLAHNQGVSVMGNSWIFKEKYDP